MLSCQTFLHFSIPSLPRYAVVLGGYGPGYTELSMVEVVRHDRVCRNIISDIPPALARFLGDVSGLAEFVDDKVRRTVPRQDQ